MQCRTVLVSLWCERGEPGVVEKVAVLLSDLFVFNIAIVVRAFACVDRDYVLYLQF